MSDFTITIYDHDYEINWRIVDIYLKLRLKYGLEGPWEKIAQSRHFDEYALSRGPHKGLPTVIDFASTLLMNSGIRSTELSTISSWLMSLENNVILTNIRDLLIQYDDLHSIPDSDLNMLGKSIDKIKNDRENLSGINVARIFKWLSAWAPKHIPMFDALVFRALTGKDALRSSVDSFDLFVKFKTILDEHYENLKKAGEALSRELWPNSNLLIPPVRVLDNVIWFDWDCSEYKERQRDFREFIDFKSCNDCYPAKK